ncbi:MAG: fatty-acid synthase [Chloroflexi bacterium]|nr:fatty-acid synthase [Chloroflexota bacterium]
MANKDIYHDTVKRVLIKDGWQITHDPLTVAIGRRDGYIDLGAEKICAAEHNGRKLQSRKSFTYIPLARFVPRLRQYLLYREALQIVEPERILYLAVRHAIYEQLEREQLRDLLDRQQIKFVVFDAEKERIVEWTT